MVSVPVPNVYDSNLHLLTLHQSLLLQVCALLDANCAIGAALIDLQLSIEYLH